MQIKQNQGCPERFCLAYASGWQAWVYVLAHFRYIKGHWFVYPIIPKYLWWSEPPFICARRTWYLFGKLAIASSKDECCKKQSQRGWLLYKGYEKLIGLNIHGQAHIYEFGRMGTSDMIGGQASVFWASPCCSQFLLEFWYYLSSILIMSSWFWIMFLPTYYYHTMSSGLKYCPSCAS